MFFSFILNLIVFLTSPDIYKSADFFTDINYQKVEDFPEIESSKAVVFYPEKDVFIYEKNSDEIQPIASISKLMTALVFLDTNPDWEKTYTITRDDNISGGRLHLFLGEEISLKDIFYTSLIASDNGATIALVHASGLSEEEFVEKMNDKAKDLFLFNTSFSDPIGLSDDNVSNAREVAMLLDEALKRKEIAITVKMPEYSFKTINGRSKNIESTDYLLFSDSNNLKPLGGKTGYTDKAGYCFAGKFITNDNKIFISVILNASTKNNRFVESRDLAESVWTNYEINR